MAEYLDTLRISLAMERAMFQECEIPPECEDRTKAPEGAVLVEGIVGRVAFHPERLEAQRELIENALLELPHGFRDTEGGGWSFLNAHMTADGEQWSGVNRTVEMLFLMGLGLGVVKCLAPRTLWDQLPQGMPYYAVLTKEMKIAKVD